MAKSVNLDAVTRYVHLAEISKLDSLVMACERKAAELGIKPGKPHKCDTTGDVSPTGNVRGMIEFVDSVTSAKEDAESREQFACLLACVRQRFKQAQRQPPTGELVMSEAEKEAEKQRQADRVLR